MLKKEQKFEKEKCCQNKTWRKGQYCKNYMLLIERSNDHLSKQEQNLHNIAKQKKHMPKKP
jgi:lipopolysaccharide biosynthesis glycosyltransferase